MEAINAQAQGHGSHSNNSILDATLPQNIEMSYDKGKKLLDESEKVSVLLKLTRDKRGRIKRKIALETVSVSLDEKHPQTVISSANGAKI